MLLISAKIIGQSKVTEIKKYAFNQCVILNYSKIDSIFYNKLNDASTVQFSVRGNFIEDSNLIKNIIDYTVLKTSNYYSQKNNLHLRQEIKILFFVIVLIFMNPRNWINS